ncbi:WhiB family transcriptional regulator [Nonomuraea sp. NPDC004580]|uniref:WhiB family transcriptional regulator n=1 Tax=Nonomuraea sp. NPDC004580 TaxID=3154552 RepID=UPI0033A09F50
MTSLLGYTPPWDGVGLCADRPHLMADPNTAKATCRRCPVLPACRDWVLSIPIHEGPDGVVAALTFAERERILLDREPPRKCDTCREVKPLSAYAQNAEGKPSRRNTCRPCVDHRTHTKRKQKADTR